MASGFPPARELPVGKVIKGVVALCDGGFCAAEGEFSFFEKAVDFGYEGGGEEAVVVDELGAVWRGDAGGGGGVPAQVSFEEAAGGQLVDAVGGLLPEPPAVAADVVFVVDPVFEAAGFD